MALAIYISSYVSPGYVNPVIWRLYEAGSNVLVDEHQEIGPHGVIYNFAFTTNIRDVVYTIKFYDQPGGTGVGILVKSHDITVSTSTLTFDADIELVVDNGQPEDPISGTSTSPAIASLIGKDWYVAQRSIGQRRIVKIPEVTINNDGTFTLLSGETFNAEDTWIIKVRPQYVVNPPGSQGLGAYKDVLLITADTTIAPTDFGKLLIIEGAANVITLQLPVIANILTKLSLWVRSVGTDHINVIIKAATGETITATGTTSNTFILGKATEAEIINLSGILYGFTDDTDIKKRGQIEWGYYAGLNRLIADGQDVLIADYPGLKKAIDNMPPSSVCTEMQWNSSLTVNYVADVINGVGAIAYEGTKIVYPYKGKFALTDDGLSIILPDLRNMFIRSLKDPSLALSDDERLIQGAGGYQIDDFKAHLHKGDTSGTDTGSGKPTVGGGASDGSVTTFKTGGSETRGENIGLIPLVII